MFLVDKLLLLTAVLMILGIISSKFSARLGLPVLVLFMVVGMLAGSEGLGRIHFEDLQLAHGVGSVALALILFDGGLNSPVSSLRMAWKPAAVLATVGVVGTSLITGLVATWALGLSLLEGMLLGSIVGSTDAAAVFAVLRNAGLRLRQRLAATLEIESGANDPMAIFLTVGIIQLLTGETGSIQELVPLFLKQMGLGLVVGYGVARLSQQVINRINLASGGLYPILTMSCGLLAFGLAALLEGSGFLAIYIAGLVLGNAKLTYQRETLFFHGAMAWAGQITMFVLLGLLSNPSELVDVALPSLLVASALILLARPLTVVPLLLPFHYTARELVLISWVGLKGAVPIILATYPLLAGLPSGRIIFNVVFFVVLLSATLQGGLLPLFARKLELEEPAEPEPPLSIMISSLRDVDAEILDYQLGAESRATGRPLRDLALPEGAVAALLSRGSRLVPPRGSTVLEPGDHIFMVVNGESKGPVDRIFSRRPTTDQAVWGEFPLRGSTTVDAIAATYGLTLGESGKQTLEELILKQVQHPVEGTVVNVGGARLRVRELSTEGRILAVALALPEDAPDEGDASDQTS